MTLHLRETLVSDKAKNKLVMHIDSDEFLSLELSKGSR